MEDITAEQSGGKKYNSETDIPSILTDIVHDFNGITAFITD